MRHPWALLVLVACRAEDEPRPTICEPCPNQFLLEAHTNLTPDQLRYATVRVCKNDVTCGEATFDDTTCQLDRCALHGQLELEIDSFDPGVLVFGAFLPNYAATETWSVTIRDGSTLLYSARGTSAWTIYEG